LQINYKKIYDLSLHSQELAYEWLDFNRETKSRTGKSDGYKWLAKGWAKS